MSRARVRIDPKEPVPAPGLFGAANMRQLEAVAAIIRSFPDAAIRLAHGRVPLR